MPRYRPTSNTMHRTFGLHPVVAEKESEGWTVNVVLPKILEVEVSMPLVPGDGAVAVLASLAESYGQVFQDAPLYVRSMASNRTCFMVFDVRTDQPLAMLQK